MRQALYNNISGVNISGNSIQANTAANTDTAGTSAPKSSGLLRWVARRWDMVGVLALMGSSAAYAAFALAHVGL